MNYKLLPISEGVEIMAECSECGFIATGTLIKFDEPTANGTVFSKDGLVITEAVDNFTDNTKCPFCRGMLERVE